MVDQGMDISCKSFIRKALCLIVMAAFMLTSLVPASYAQAVFNLPQPGEMIGLSGNYTPVVLQGMAIHPEAPLLFDFIVDNGNSDLKGQALTDETTKLVKYFLAGLAVPEKELWVNLSPVEKDRIMADQLSHTDAGRDMLGQDYILKQITSTLMYPEKDLGRKFWDEIYSRVYTKFGNTQVPVDTFNKVWITPDVAEVYQHEGNAFVTKAHLKVMLEADYHAAQGIAAAVTDADNTQTVELARDVVREVILPVLEKEVNEGKNFAPLRQIFHSLILAGWYKNALKNSLLNQVYAGTNKVDGIDIAEKNAKAQVYAQYLQAYQKGVYNYVKEEFDRTTQETLPRKYFSGGLDAAQMMRPTVTHILNAGVIKGIRATIAVYRFLKQGKKSTSSLEKDIVNKSEMPAKVDQAENVSQASDAHMQQFYKDNLTVDVINSTNLRKLWKLALIAGVAVAEVGFGFYTATSGIYRGPDTVIYLPLTLKIEMIIAVAPTLASAIYFFKKTIAKYKVLTSNERSESSRQQGNRALGNLLKMGAMNELKKLANNADVDPYFAGIAASLVADAAEGVKDETYYLNNLNALPDIQMLHDAVYKDDLNLTELRALLAAIHVQIGVDGYLGNLDEKSVLYTPIKVLEELVVDKKIIDEAQTDTEKKVTDTISAALGPIKGVYYYTMTLKAKAVAAKGFADAGDFDALMLLVQDKDVGAYARETVSFFKGYGQDTLLFMIKKAINQNALLTEAQKLYLVDNLPKTSTFEYVKAVTKNTLDSLLETYGVERDIVDGFKAKFAAASRTRFNKDPRFFPNNPDRKITLVDNELASELFKKISKAADAMNAGLMRKNLTPDKLGYKETRLAEMADILKNVKFDAAGTNNQGQLLYRRMLKGDTSMFRKGNNTVKISDFGKVAADKGVLLMRLLDDGFLVRFNRTSVRLQEKNAARPEEMGSAFDDIWTKLTSDDAGLTGSVGFKSEEFKVRPDDERSTFTIDDVIKALQSRGSKVNQGNGLRDAKIKGINKVLLDPKLYEHYLDVPSLAGITDEKKKEIEAQALYDLMLFNRNLMSEGNPGVVPVIPIYLKRLVGAIEDAPKTKDNGEKTIGDVTKQVQGGIDLGQGDYLKVVGTDAAGMPQFDPAQLMQLQKDLRGIVPVPVGGPQPVNLRPLLGLDAHSGNDNFQVSQLDPAKVDADDAVNHS